MTAIRGGRPVRLGTTTYSLGLGVEGEPGPMRRWRPPEPPGFWGVSIFEPSMPCGAVAGYGVVPNEVTSIVVRNAGGGVLATAPVQNNAFRVVLVKAALAGLPSPTWRASRSAPRSLTCSPSDLGCA